MAERHYQPQVIKRLRKEFPGCLILKNDSSYMQGVPDLIILFGDRWAMLEVKASKDSAFQPNQAYYVSELNHMSYAAFIFPENEDEVFRDLQHALRPRRATRIPVR
ncbi:MAG: hypothetical protein ACJ74Y_13915 [Bryobacteraceae bacterium]|jgi:Holliday junction resolvase-like predicted endonuclease